MLKFTELWKNTELAEAMRFMNDSTHQFYLTGSRFFGGENSESDWDFFAQYKDSLHEDMLNSGFEEHASYRSHTGVNVVFKKGIVHIQLVENCEEKLLVQNMIKNNVHMASLVHGHRRMVWNIAYKAFREGLLAGLKKTGLKVVEMDLKVSQA